jgi:aspartyl-tRNA(Asn)/glutamyl-tRNA(Gln) amidotransferase subunit C
MKLTLQQVRHVARLARLELSAEEEVQFVTQLSAILDAVELLGELDTSQVPPTASVADLAPPSRVDVPGRMLEPEGALANAPQRVGTSFAIPRVLE